MEEVGDLTRYPLHVKPSQHSLIPRPSASDVSDFVLTMLAASSTDDEFQPFIILDFIFFEKIGPVSTAMADQAAHDPYEKAWGAIHALRLKLVRL